MTLRDTASASATSVAAIYAALAQETRLEAFRLLVRYQPFGLMAGDIARLLAVPHNTLSGHLSVLHAAGLVRSRKEGRAVIFAAETRRLAEANAFLGQGLPNSMPAAFATQPATYPDRKPGDATGRAAHNVLVLCTGNSARSILAEAILNREGQGRLRAFSAGSQPSGEPHPQAISLLMSLGYDTADLRSKSWLEFAGAGAPELDFVVTVCDIAAGETCPRWPGHPLAFHWGIPDPAAISGTPGQIRAAFQATYRQLMNRITTLVNLPVAELPLTELKTLLAEIGLMEGASPLTLQGIAA